MNHVQELALERQQSHRKAIGWWLVALSALTVFMVALGGMTRLTHSGLSMTDWTFTGSLPPIGQEAWQAEFERYQQFPEYQKVNQGMDLDGFKSIFWYEYSHRMLGRTIGNVFLLGALFFGWRKAIDRTLAKKLAGLFVLLCTQGLIGWWMVRSGLVDRPDVSHYRLTVHLGAAFAFYAALLWVALGQFRGPAIGRKPLSPRLHLARAAAVVGVLVFLTSLAGGLVAGSNAGFIYNTFPLMDGQLVPDGLLHRDPWYMNFLEHPKTIQFQHRVLAITTFFAVMALAVRGIADGVRSGARTALKAAAAVAVVQVGLGITTLLTVVWVPAASLHQLGALALLSAMVWVNHTLWRPRGHVWADAPAK